MTAAPHLHVVRDGDDPEAIPPPWDPEAEAAVLSAVLLDASAIPKVSDFLRVDHFFPEANRRIYEACLELFAEKTPIDPTTVASQLRSKGRLAQVGGAAYILEVANGSPAVVNVRAHAIAIHDTWRRRRVMQTCQRAEATARTAVGDVQAFIDATTKALAVVGADNPVRPVESNAQALTKILDDALSDKPQNAAASDLRGFPTGLHSLDEIFAGMRPGAKTTLAAPTGVGKTALALQFALSVARRGGGVLFFSTELKRRELLRRALAATAKIPGRRIKRRQLGPGEPARLIEAANEINRLPLWIDETARLSVEQLRASAAAQQERCLLVERVPLAMIVVDYVQRLESSPSVLRLDRHRQVAHSTKELKLLAQELGVAVLELAQSKSPDGKGKKRRPNAETGIAESGVIAKESDEVIFIHPLEDDNTKPDQDVALVLGKQRDEGKGEVQAVFHRDVSWFEDPNDPMRCASRDYVDTNPLTEGM